MSDYTFEDVRRVLHELAEERPEYVYEPPEQSGGECVYSTPDGAPSCIVGHLINRLDPEEFQQIAEREWEWDEEADVPVVYPMSAVELRWTQQFAHNESQAIRIVQDVQDEQDDRSNWARAVKAFDEFLMAEAD